MKEGSPFDRAPHFHIIAARSRARARVYPGDHMYINILDAREMPKYFNHG
jgi:hypothetical protein